MRMGARALAPMLLLSVLAFSPRATARAQVPTTDAGAPGGWHRAAADSVVQRAIARRGLQLADSTLLSFEANAHGFLAFVVQLGEGTLIPPRVVQSEELASRLYWWQPGRSVQRLVGRRDTTLLPASVGYYRDRYQVVLDNLPDLIRLGDGQDVRDVPHPLSQVASTQYEFRRAGQVRIRIPGRDIVVDEVRFRPIDDTRAAAVGSLFLDRESGAVVRLSMAFTRAAIIDRRIETLVLTLENALINGRYWLPRRQEVEVSRKATWFDIPTKGIVRGRWQVSDYQVNERVAPEVTRLPRWSVAPRDSLRAFPFEQRIVDVLPPDIQVASDEELTAARKQVEEAVRAAALARPARAALSGRGISDFARFTRTEGLALGAGVTRRVGGARVNARMRYGFGDEQLKGQVAIGRISGLGGEPIAQLFAEREYRDVMLPERAGVTNSLAALLFGSDFTTRVDTRAVGVTARRGPLDAWSLRVAYESDRPLGVVSQPVHGTFAPTPAMWRLDGVRAELRGSGGRVPDEARGMRVTWTLSASGGAYHGTDRADADVRPLVARVSGYATLTRALGGDRQLVAYSQATLATGRDLPPQWLGYAGGPWSAPGYEFASLTGKALLSQRLELRAPIPAPSIPLGRYGRSPGHVTLAPYLQATALGGAERVPLLRRASEPGVVETRRRVDGVYPSAGLGVLLFYDLLRVDVARGLRDGVWRLGVDIERGFWGVL